MKIRKQNQLSNHGSISPYYVFLRRNVIHISIFFLLFLEIGNNQGVFLINITLWGEVTLRWQSFRSSWASWHFRWLSPFTGQKCWQHCTALFHVFRQKLPGIESNSLIIKYIQSYQLHGKNQLHWSYTCASSTNVLHELPVMIFWRRALRVFLWMLKNRICMAPVYCKGNSSKK